MSILRRMALPACTLMLLGLSPAPPDTSLDDLWFKVKVSAHGYAIRPDGSAPHKFHRSDAAYIHLMFNVPKTTSPADEVSLPETGYLYELWTDMWPGPWELWFCTYESWAPIESTDGRSFFVPAMSCVIYPSLNFQYKADVTLMIKVARNKSGAVTGATLQSLGGEIWGGTTESGLPGVDTLRGGLSIKGKMVKEGTLPFTH